MTWLRNVLGRRLHFIRNAVGWQTNCRRCGDYTAVAFDWWEGRRQHGWYRRNHHCVPVENDGTGRDAPG